MTKAGQPQGAGQTSFGGALASELVDMEQSSKPPPTPVATRFGRVVLAVSLILVSLNLRLLFSSLAAVMPEVRAATGASPGTASLLTTAPVLCLGLFAAGAPPLARRFGAERVILALLVTLAIGTALRGFGTISTLLLGSAVAGGAIAMVNVLLPGLVKRDFPDRVALLTGLYSMALSAGAAVASGLTVPIERQLGGSWSSALAVWAVPALIVAALWAPQAVRSRAVARGAGAASRGSLLRDPLAWFVAFLMGLQSAMAYCVFGWLAPLLRARGLDPAVAGYVVSVSVLCQMAGSLSAPTFATRGPDQRPVCFTLLAMTLVGFMGCLFAPLWTVWGWAGLLGVGQGGLVAVALTIIVLRAPDALVAARMSSMAQGIGYTLAAFGPLLMGLIFTSTGNLQATAGLVLVLGAGCGVAAWGAGRDRLLAPR